MVTQSAGFDKRNSAAEFTLEKGRLLMGRPLVRMASEFEMTPYHSIAGYRRVPVWFGVHQLPAVDKH
jgi:hypothetical protein